MILTGASPGQWRPEVEEKAWRSRGRHGGRGRRRRWTWRRRRRSRGRHGGREAACPPKTWPGVEASGGGARRAGVCSSSAWTRRRQGGRRRGEAGSGRAPRARGRGGDEAAGEGSARGVLLERVDGAAAPAWKGLLVARQPGGVGLLVARMGNWGRRSLVARFILQRVFGPGSCHERGLKGL